ncbi:MAG: undecaprenyl-phosphate glucose phosphotransferase [Bacteroidota bacterium]
MQFYNNKIYTVRLVSDLVIIAISMFLSLLLIKHFQFEILKPLELLFVLYQLISWYFVVKANDLYNDSRSKKGLANEIFKTILSVGVLAITLIFLLFFVDYEIYGPKFVVYYILLLVFLLSIEKFILKQVLHSLRKKGLNIRRVVIIGQGKAALRFFNLINRNTDLGYQVVGFVDDEELRFDRSELLGGISDLKGILERHKIHEVIVAVPNVDNIYVNEISDIVNNVGCRIRIIPDYYHFYHNKFVVKNFGDIPVVSIRKEPLEEPHWRNVKRMFDVVFSVFVLLTVCIWLFPIIALLIRINSKGPIFFSQKRLGRDRKEFDCYKFRSMYVNKSADSLQATKGDSRITKIGNILRKTSLDELPQFWNVLKGEMSVVGPRPHMMKHNIEYSKIIDDYMVRQLVKPGITGWAQVNGFRGETKEDVEMSNRVEYDVWYLENWFFLLDLKIIFLTVWNVFKGEEKAF